MRKIVFTILCILIPLYVSAQTSEVEFALNDKQFADYVITNYEVIGNLSEQIFDISVRGAFAIYSPKDRDEMLTEIKDKAKSIASLLNSMQFNDKKVYLINEDPVSSGISHDNSEYVLRNPLKISNSMYTEELIAKTETTPNSMNEIRLLTLYFLTNISLELEYQRFIISQK